MIQIGAVVLAAGGGTRLGGVAKALLVRTDRTFLGTILATAGEVGLAHAIVVVGPPYGDAVAIHAHELGARTVINAEPGRGMASSVALGFAAIADTPCDAAWLWPVDHPDVSPATLRDLAAALGDHEGARPTFEGRGGHPPLIARSLFARLAACSDDDHGARGVLAAADVVDVAVGDRGCVHDVDTQIDLEATT